MDSSCSKMILTNHPVIVSSNIKNKSGCFNIGGNNYRMICKYHFGATRVHLFIQWIGTHTEYTKLCNESKQFDINNY